MFILGLDITTLQIFSKLNYSNFTKRNELKKRKERRKRKLKTRLPNELFKENIKEWFRKEGREKNKRNTEREKKKSLNILFPNSNEFYMV